MIDEDAVKTERSLTKTKKVCRFINIAIRVIFVIFCVSWILVAGMMFLSTMGEYEGILRFIFFCASGIVIAAMFIVLIMIFSDVAKGESPFDMIQVRRLRIIASLLLIYAISDFAATYNTASLEFSTLNSGYVSTNDSVVIAVNFATFIAAAVVFAFSFVFQYGVLLQEFSDDTV